MGLTTTEEIPMPKKSTPGSLSCDLTFHFGRRINSSVVYPTENYGARSWLVESHLPHEATATTCQARLQNIIGTRSLISPRFQRPLSASCLPFVLLNLLLIPLHYTRANLPLQTSQTFQTKKVLSQETVPPDTKQKFMFMNHKRRSVASTRL